MQFFLDTADVGEIREALAMGLLDGVTTNPSLVRKTGRTMEDCLREICSVVAGPVSAEVLATDAEGMLREAEHLAAIGDGIVIKLPLTLEGLRACRALTARGVKTNLTLCFSPTQGLLAAKAGATYVSPFVGRLDDVSHVGMDTVRQLLQIYRNYGFATRVLVASIRHPVHVLEAALAGAHVATVPLAVLRRLVDHPLTEAGLARFVADGRQIPGQPGR